MKKIIKSIAFIAGVTILASCADRLEVTPPNNIYDEQIKELLENGTAAQKETILKAIVNPMAQYFNNYDRNNVCSTGSANVMNYSYPGIEWGRSLMGNDVALGYDLESYDLAGRDLYQFVTDYRIGNSNTNYCHWTTYAYAINQANSVLGYMTEELAQTDNLFKDGRARALLIRAYSYMCMMEEYQDAYLLGGKDKLGLSIYKVYDPKQPAVARSTSEETWNFIKGDIQEAVSLLTNAGVKYTAGRANAEDFDLGVANFLLARASLLTGDYATCVSACRAIISSGAYSLIKPENYGGRNTGAWSPTSDIEVSPATNAFTNINVNPETILGYAVTSSFYAQAAVFFGLTSMFTSYSSSKSTARIDDRLYNKISDKDVRKDAFLDFEVGDYTFAVNGAVAKIPSYASMKFSSTDALNNDGTAGAGTPASTTKCDYTKFRLSEVYLMLAEALCQTNADSEAQNILNELLAARAKEGETLTIDDYKSAGSTLDIVKLQWRIEMWGEGGREYYNNKRWGVNVDRSGSTVHPKIVSYPANKMTLAMPERELQDNSECVDNQLN
jgi:hypothetical protein